MLQSPSLGPFALIAAGGIAAFFTQIAWMKRHPRPAPRELPRPDLGVLHALQAFAYLRLSALLGVVLAFAPPSEWALRAQMLYGCLGLVGFLAQIVVGVENRLLPLASWLWGFADRGFTEMPAPLHSLASRWIQAVVLALWTAGVPLLAAGLYATREDWISGGSGALLAAVLLGTAGAARVLRSA
jgi:hypothetical protein